MITLNETTVIEMSDAVIIITYPSKSETQGRYMDLISPYNISSLEPLTVCQNRSFC
jgi:hypothetical protein